MSDYAPPGYREASTLTISESDTTIMQGMPQGDAVTIVNMGDDLLILRREPMRDIYLVIQRGVYRHDVVGAFSTKEFAIAAASDAARAESDHYHFFEILVCVIDTRTEPSRIGSDESMPLPVYVINRKKDGTLEMTQSREEFVERELAQKRMP